MILIEVLVLEFLVQRNTIEVVLAVRTEVCTIVELEHIVTGTCSVFGRDVSFLIFFLDDDRTLKTLALDRLLVADDIRDGETFAPEFQTALQPDSLLYLVSGSIDRELPHPVLGMDRSAADGEFPTIVLQLTDVVVDA